MPESPLWITEADVIAVMDMADAIRALEAGLRAEARGAAINMAKTHVEWSSGHSTTSTRSASSGSTVSAVGPSTGSGQASSGQGHSAGSGQGGVHSTLHAIGAAFVDEGFVGTKTWAHTAGGATPVLVLFDSRSGALKAILEAFALGQMRTGATSGVATALLAAPGADELAIIGTGKQAIAQIAAVAAVRSLKRVRVFGHDAGRRAQCATRVRDELGLDAREATTVAEAVREAPIITLVTRAREPFLTASMVAHGAHINAVGAITRAGAEVAVDVLARCGQVVADSVAQAQRLSSELIPYFGSAPDGWTRVQSLAGIVVSGRGRAADDDVTLFKSLGMGVSDLSLAIEVYARAVKTGIGRSFAHPVKAAPRLRPAKVQTHFEL